MGKHKNDRIKKWVICLVGALALAACTYHTPDEDWEENGRVRLLLDWQTRAQPSVMTYHFYKDGTGSPVVRRGMLGDMKEHFGRDIIKWLFVIPTVRMFCWRRKTDMTGLVGGPGRYLP